MSVPARAGPPGRLVARARRRGPAFDLLAACGPDGFLFERAGLGVSGSGVAVRVSARGGPGRGRRLAARALEALRSLDRRGEGAVPVVVGAVPFDQDLATHLVVPAQPRRPSQVYATPATSADGGATAPAFRAGDRVRHPRFGEGVVVSCTPTGDDHLVTVAFKGEAGIKKLLLSLARLEHAGPQGAS